MPGLRIADWGPAGWNFLHAIAHTRPTHLDADEIERMRRFLHDVAHYLPCKKCSHHFSTFLRARATDAALSTREGIVRLLHDAHNDVNVRSGKRAMSLSEHHRRYSLDATAPSHGALPVVCALACLVVLTTCAARKKNDLHT